MNGISLLYQDRTKTGPRSHFQSLCGQGSFQTAKDTKNQGRGPLEPENQKILVAETMAAVRLYSEKLFEAEIQVAYNLLAASKWDSAFDQIKLSFDSDGRLAHILGISQSQLPNLAWGNEPDFLQALQKGNNKQFGYNPKTHRLLLFFELSLEEILKILLGSHFQQ